jgi:hypothetical protein
MRRLDVSSKPVSWSSGRSDGARRTVQGDGVQIADPSGHRVGWHRPIALPDDIDDSKIEEAHRLVRLPGHV